MRRRGPWRFGWGFAALLSGFGCCERVGCRATTGSALGTGGGEAREGTFANHVTFKFGDVVERGNKPGPTRCTAGDGVGDYPPAAEGFECVLLHCGVLAVGGNAGVADEGDVCDGPEPRQL